MKISEVTTEYIRNFLRLDDESFDSEIEIYKSSAIDFICNYTGLTKEEIEEYEDLTQAYLVLISDFFENHLYQQGKTADTMNKVVEIILNHHRKNFL